MTPDQLFAEVDTGFKDSKYLAGLVLAEIDMLTAMGVPGSGLKNFDDVLARYTQRPSIWAGSHSAHPPGCRYDL